MQTMRNAAEYLNCSIFDLQDKDPDIVYRAAAYFAANNQGENMRIELARAEAAANRGHGG